MANDPLWPESNMERRDIYYRQFMNKDEIPNGIDLEVHREDRNGRTFSTEVMEQLLDMQVAFMAARMKRHWNETEKPPHTIRISVNIEIES